MQSESVLVTAQNSIQTFNLNGIRLKEKGVIFLIEPMGHTYDESKLSLAYTCTHQLPAIGTYCNLTQGQPLSTDGLKNGKK